MAKALECMDYLFQFEQDKYYALRRIPMAMRIKLDLCGFKLSIRDWSKLSRNDREALAAMPYESEAQLAAFRECIDALIAGIEGDSEATAPCTRPAAWEITGEIPHAISRQLEDRGVPPLSVRLWAALSELQRYALIKLTREGGKNEKLPAALQEFGLMPEADQAR